MKIPGHQIERLVNILIFYKIDKQNDDMVKSHFEQDIRDKIITNRSPFKTRKRLPHLTMYGNVPNLKDFMMEKVILVLFRLRKIFWEIKRKSWKFNLKLWMGLTELLPKPWSQVFWNDWICILIILTQKMLKKS